MSHHHQMVDDLLSGRRLKIISDWEREFLERVKDRPVLTEWQAQQLSCTYRSLGGFSVAKSEGTERSTAGEPTPQRTEQTPISPVSLPPAA
jgi:hypothetical protein